MRRREVALVYAGTEYPNGRMFGVRVRHVSDGWLGTRATAWLSLCEPPDGCRKWPAAEARDIADAALTHGWTPSNWSTLTAHAIFTLDESDVD